MNPHICCVSLLLAVASCTGLLAQHPVDLRNTYDRLLCVVPMVGAGTPDDPRRPLFAPGQVSATSRGVIAFTYQISDDGKHALVEFVARDRDGLREILEANRSDVKIFHKGRDKRDNIEKEFRKYKKDFDLDRFGLNVP